MFFLLPWTIGFLAFTLYPMVASFIYSFSIYHAKAPLEWVGLQNYIDLFKDDLFWKSLYNTFYMVIISVPLSLLVSFFCAVLLNLKVRGQSIYRVIYFLPSIVPTVASTILWLWIMNPQAGILNTLLGKIGIDGPNWMSNPAWSKPGLILLGLWGIGSTIVIYLSGLQDVSPSPARGCRTGWSQLVAEAMEYYDPHGLADHTVQPDHGCHLHLPVFCAGVCLPRLP